MNQDEDNKLDLSNLSDELAKVEQMTGEDDGSSISDKNIEDDDNASLDGDTWIEELECALLADCDPSTLKKISEGRRIPTTLRPDYWRALLSLNDAGKVKLNGEYDLENQLEIRQDCDSLIEDISTNLAQEPLNEAEKLRLRSDFESCLTTYVKARPELTYIPGNGWIDILRVLYNLQLSDVQLYQMFFRIVDRYIPKDLSHRTKISNDKSTNSSVSVPETANKNIMSKELSEIIRNASDNKKNTKEKELPKISSDNNISARKTEDNNKSIQAYHLLRLLIQYHDPELCSILDSRKVTPNLYVKDWFCSLFARSCSPKLALIIWDTHFKMADPFLIFFAAIVMVVNASDELKKSNMNQAAMLSVLNGMPNRLEEDDIEDLYYLVSNHYTNSTPRSIRSYSHLFFMDTFANTYSGNENSEESSPLLDLKTSQLTSSLDLSQYLCLPIVPAEILALDTAEFRSSPTQSTSTLKYFLVDCRPSEQYNAGHLTRAFHLDCSLMLREPSSFATAVQALLEIQRQVVASKSNTGGQHLCFIGSGHEEEDQYVNMVVASFLQKYQKYVSIVVGGFEAIHDYVSTKSELKDSFDKYIIDHNPEMCKPCYSKSADFSLKNNKSNKKLNVPVSSGMSSAQYLFASTTSFLRGDKSSSSLGFKTTASNQSETSLTANLIAQSGASMFDKFTTAFVSKSSVIKDRLVETLNTTSIPSATSLTSLSGGGRDHVSSQDKLGKRYTVNSLRYTIDDNEDDLTSQRLHDEGRVDGVNEPIQEIQIDTWQRETNIIAFYKCAQIKGNSKYPGYIALSKTHLWILREIPHNKGFASIAAKRPLDMIVQITSKRRQPDLIIFRYGLTNHRTSQQQQQQPGPDSSQTTQEGDQNRINVKSMPSIVASDQLHIPQAFEVIRLIKREIIRIMDENSKANSPANSKNNESKEEDGTKKDNDKTIKPTEMPTDDKENKKSTETIETIPSEQKPSDDSTNK